MKISTTKVLATAAIGLLSIGLLAPANAVGPSDSKITLVAPVLTAANTSEAAKNQATADGWVANGWFGTGTMYQRVFVPVSSNTVLTYHVVDKNGKPLINQSVTLRVSKGYSASTAIVQVGNYRTKGNGTSTNPLDGADVQAMTDAFGDVTYTVQDLDALPLGEGIPASPTSAPNISADGLNGTWTQELLQVAGEKQDHSVFVEFHYVAQQAATPGPATHPTLHLVSPVFDNTNSTELTAEEMALTTASIPYAKGMTVKQAYAPVGSNFVVTYQVLDDNGAPLPNTVVKLRVGTAGSKSNASIKSGAVATNVKSAGDQLTLQATSDALGYVVFSLKNADVKGEAAPASPTATAPTAGAVFSSIYPQIAGTSSDVADLLTIHFYSVPRTITCVKGKSSKKVTGVSPVCPTGYKKK